MGAQAPSSEGGLRLCTAVFPGPRILEYTSLHGSLAFFPALPYLQAQSMLPTRKCAMVFPASVQKLIRALLVLGAALALPAGAAVEEIVGFKRSPEDQ